MVEKGAQHLRENVDQVNALNVFPVPDGDTGTNMNLTLTSGVEELRRRPSQYVGKSAEALAKGLLMGARGNSGVILSQLFRGFSKAVADAESIDARQFAAALQNGVDMAYKAVVKPVEGTILTVAREAAKHGVHQAGRTTAIVELMREICKKGNTALSNTPELLAVLKQVGVVDAGGQGLLFIYEGFLRALEQDSDAHAGNRLVATAGAREALGDPYIPNAAPHANRLAKADQPKRAQAMLSTEDIEFGYCTEFIVSLNGRNAQNKPFHEQEFREQLSALGNSLLVVADDDLVKVHIHAEYPGSVMNLAMNYGELSRIKIENMRDQHTHLLMEEAEEIHKAAFMSDDGAVPVDDTDEVSVDQKAEALKQYGFVAVSAGAGFASILSSLGVDEVLHGGQTMNPSTEDIVNAVHRVSARTVFVLPNNSNIILAAQQAVELVDDKQIVVIPTKTLPQGIAAMIAFQANAATEHNVELMQQAVTQVQSGQITYAVRDTQIDDMEIKQGDYIGIHNNKIVTADPDFISACTKLLDSLLQDGAELVTLYAGEEAQHEQTEQLVKYMEEHYGDAEVEVHQGGQPLYYYIVSAE
ncbi:DAK2 domain-containing protein [Paenibacillus xerothermodurans]|uniref:DAK2 domain-containing protein n=2 Tax=Paenibacillus xerothermodurans TaxID=1977292 RepID=A0A2W1NYP7_PAEXE|nr:DAK2 domain-containing protein [Paenibacillus xerothermodurans]